MATRSRAVPEVGDAHDPSVVVAAPGVPGQAGGGDLLLGQPGLDQLGERRRLAGGGAATGRAQRLLDHVLPLGEHGHGVALDPLGADAGRDRDLVDAVAGTDAGLDLAGAELTLQGDLQLAVSSGTVGSGALGGAQRVGQPLVDRHAELMAVVVLEDEVAAVRGHCDEPEVGDLGCDVRRVAHRCLQVVSSRLLLRLPRA